jgi:hypothetical protein
MKSFQGRHSGSPGGPGPLQLPRALVSFVIKSGTPARRLGSVLFAAVSLSGMFPGALVAQGAEALDQVEALMAEGRIMEAREALVVWLDSRLTSAGREDRQRGIWLRGKLTVDPAMAEVDFRRLVLEFPGGPHSADALYRLSLLAELRGDREEALALLERLRRDYPVSPLVEDAEVWQRALVGDAAVGVRLAPHLKEGPPLPSDSLAEPLPVPMDSLEASWSFAVQLGAFSSIERARALADRLRHAGYQPRIVGLPGDELARVRVGRFPVREEAEALSKDLEGRGFEVRVVADAWSEERVGAGTEDHGGRAR